MSDLNLYDFETNCIEEMFTCKNYILKNKRHEKILYENAAGEKLIKHILHKPADISVYQRLTQISNPYLCTIYEVSQSENDYVIYEEYCGGITLTEFAGDVSVSEYDALEITCQICKGLHALHSCEIIHRDIKPDNIIVLDNNNVKIIDFDIAKIYKQDNSIDTTVLGTVGFAAPEQFGFTQSGPGTDLYSLSVVLNYILVGEHPSVKMCSNKHIAKILKKCLSINIYDRYTSADSLYHALKKVQRRIGK